MDISDRTVERPWTYKGDERPRGECYDCRLSYDHPQFVDLHIPDEIWEEINPTPHEGAGLLCPNCIGRRLCEVGISPVDATIWAPPIEDDNL